MPTTPKPDPKTPGEVTRLLQAWQGGDETAREQLIPFVYQELRKRAAGFLRRERRGHTFRPTDLVHETYLRLCAQNGAWENRDQFFGVACRLMRRHSRGPRPGPGRPEAQRGSARDSFGDPG